MPRVRLDSGVALSYVMRGPSSGPALLLLPGPTDAWRSYRPVLPHLPRRLRAVAVSQRGHGRSDRPSSGFAVEDFAADAVSLLDALGLERAILAGHSASCLVARRVALDHPSRVAGLVLEASPTTLRGDARLTGFVESLSALADPISPDFARSFVRDTSAESLPAALLEPLVRDVLQVPAHVWRQMFAEILRYDDLAELPAVEAPTLLVWGDADTLITREMQHVLLGALRKSSLVVHPGAGHTPRWEDPVRFARDVAAFAERIEHGVEPASAG